MHNSVFILQIISKSFTSSPFYVRYFIQFSILNSFLFIFHPFWLTLKWTSIDILGTNIAQHRLGLQTSPDLLSCNPGNSTLPWKDLICIVLQIYSFSTPPVSLYPQALSDSCQNSFTYHFSCHIDQFQALCTSWVYNLIRASWHKPCCNIDICSCKRKELFTYWFLPFVTNLVPIVVNSPFNSHDASTSKKLAWNNDVPLTLWNPVKKVLSSENCYFYVQQKSSDWV